VDFENEELNFYPNPEQSIKELGEKDSNSKQTEKFEKKL